MNNICSVKWCEKETCIKGFCSKHYNQFNKHGRVFRYNRHTFNEVVDKGKYYEIILTNKDSIEVGRAKIDKEDLVKIKCASRWSLNKQGYASYCKDGKMIRMHRILMDVKDHEFIDHKKVGDKYKLDNRKKNLRACNKSQNGMNRDKSKNNKSGHKGVSLRKDTKKWTAELSVNGKRHRLGCFNTKDEAIKAYRKAAVKLQGEFYYERKV